MVQDLKKIRSLGEGEESHRFARAHPFCTIKYLLRSFTKNRGTQTTLSYYERKGRGRRSGYTVVNRPEESS